MRLVLRFFSFLVFFSSFTSCDYFTLLKNKEVSPLDTIVDFTSVDSPPTFTECKDLIDFVEMNNCFRTTFSALFSKELAKQTLSNQLKVRNAIDEEILLNIAINKEGKLQLKELNISDKLLSEIPTIQSILNNAILKFPKIYPAIKRGIPVATEYTLPIKLKLSN